MKVESYDAVTFCKHCHSDRIRKEGVRHNKSGDVQRYKCTACGRTFSANFGFRYRQFDSAIVSEAVHLYYSGMSTRAISAAFETRGVDVDHSTVYRWVERYSKIAPLFTESLHPDVGGWLRADEVWVKIDGRQCYLFASMDDDTRYWIASDLADNKFKHNADELLRRTKKHTGKTPRHFITDGLKTYAKSSVRVFCRKTIHTGTFICRAT